MQEMMNRFVGSSFEDADLMLFVTENRRGIQRRGPAAGAHENPPARLFFWY
jgi:hypothetical protein